jgi:hypothetical protein
MVRTGRDGQRAQRRRHRRHCRVRVWITIVMTPPSKAAIYYPYDGEKHLRAQEIPAKPPCVRLVTAAPTAQPGRGFPTGTTSAASFQPGQYERWVKRRTKTPTIT